MGVTESILISVTLFACLTHLLATGSIFEPFKQRILGLIPRKWRRFEKSMAELMFCSQCLGFWIGLAGSILVYEYIPAPVGLANLLFAAAVSTTALFLTRITEKPEED